MIGTSIEHYQIIERLGQGGMGAVYRATDTLLEREVALKLLRPEYAADPQFAERFRAEAVTLAKLSHPNIATLYGFVRDSSQLCMVMELATGETLTNVLKRSGAMSWERAILLTGQMLDALQYAHERGVVHRDIKPSNLMVGSDDHLKLMDFGIARLMGTTRVTQMGFTVGTLEYMAPEQIRGEDVDGRADIYATGVVLYEMVTGQLPFKSSREQALMFAHLQQEVVPPRTYRPNLPWHLSDVIVRALAKAPADRYASAREFSDALGASIGSLTATVRVPTGHTVTGAAASPRRRTAVSRSVPLSGLRSVNATPTGLAEPAGEQRRGWFAGWWPTFRVSSNRFGGANEPGVMYQAEVGAGGFGGAIRIVAVRMTDAGRRVTAVIGGAGSRVLRNPILAVVVLLLVAVGGGLYWKRTHPEPEINVAAATLVPAGSPAPSAGGPGDPAAAAGGSPANPGAGNPASPAAGGNPLAPPLEPAPAAGAAGNPSAPPPSAGSAGSGAVAPVPANPAPAAPAATATAPGLPAPAANAPAAAGPGGVRPPAVGAKPSTVTANSANATRGGVREPVSSIGSSSTSISTPAASANTATPPASAPAPVDHPAPVVPTIPDVKLENSVTVLTPKDGDVEETEGTLTFHGNEIRIIDDDDQLVKAVRLRPDAPGKAPAVNGPAQIYTHRRDRWLVVPLIGERLVVQIDRDDIPKLIAALESRIGRPVTTVEGEPQFPKH